MSDLTRIVINRDGRTTSIAWIFSEGVLVSVTILPHDQRRPTRMIVFDNGRASVEVIDDGSSEKQIRRLP